MNAQEKEKVLTIGHSNYPIDAFIETLIQYRVTELVDVRSMPFAKFSPQFNRKALEDSLSTHGIKYVFLGVELGGRPNDRSLYHEDGHTVGLDSRPGTVSYERLANTALFQQGLDRVVEDMRENNVALMCAEKEPLDCHRTILIAQELAKRGLDTAHVLKDGTLEPHERTMERLVGTMGFTQEDGLYSQKEMLTQALSRQESKIAYSGNDRAARSSVAVASKPSFVKTESILSNVLSSARIDDVLRLAGIEPAQNEHQNIRCPLPDHDDSSASFHVQQSGQGYRCHGCGATGGVLDLVLKLGLATNKGKAVDLLAERYHIGKGTPSMQAVKPLELAIKTYPVPSFTVEDKRALTESIKGGRPLIGSPGEEYLRGRGVDPAFAASMRVGYHPSWLGRGEAVVFLGRDNEGTLTCAQGRFLDDSAEPKTMSKGKISLGAFVTPGAFERGPFAGPVAIVEGPIDAILLAQYGLPAIATFGAQNHPSGLKEALAERDVVLALDDDEAGHKAAQWYRDNLTKGTDRGTTLLFDGKKDPGELWKHSPEKLASLVTEAIQHADRLTASKIDELSLIDYAMSSLGEPEKTEPHALKNEKKEHAFSKKEHNADHARHLREGANQAYKVTILGDESLLVDLKPLTSVTPALQTTSPPVLQKIQETPKTVNPWHGVYGKHGEHATRELIEQGRTESPDPLRNPLSEKEEKEKASLSKDICGECGEVFTAKTAKESARKLQTHVEENPCEKYIALNAKAEEHRNNCAFRCGGCGEEYVTRSEIEEHVTKSQAILQAQLQAQGKPGTPDDLHYQSKLKMGLSR